MKKIIILLCILALCGCRDESTERVKLEQQLVQEQKKTVGWEILSFALATGLGLVFIVGTAIGSKGRKDANKNVS